MAFLSVFTSVWLCIILTMLSTEVRAQTWTACNPLNTTNCPSNIALGTNATFNFTTTMADSDVWNQTAGSLKYTNYGAEFIVDQRGDAPTIQSNFYIFFGIVSVVMKAATGQGIISSIVLESDDLDEVDWEIIGSNSTTVETNYFGKGNTTAYDRAIYYPVDNPQDTFHNYTIAWNAQKLEWWIDDVLVRTLKYEDALGGQNFPQTPMNVRLGVWAAGDKDNNNYTIEWAQGLTDYDKGPYTMTVASAYVQDFSTGSEYVYGDTTGSWQSIKIKNGTSSVAKEILKPHTVRARWKDLSSTAKIAIICAISGVSAALLGLLAFCCVKQRRAGRREKAVADAEWEKCEAELLTFRMKNDWRARQGLR